ncbi:unnamed protein product [Periconia digitata]|uniref:Uncharacterized protein n=1 Tax=Periconia digitata TaxID=1303443 RepID=A0A9W4U8N9_9PLEO|nr:unnamed protein product [Periconia digitata]
MRGTSIIFSTPPKEGFHAFAPVGGWRSSRRREMSWCYVLVVFRLSSLTRDSVETSSTFQRFDLFKTSFFQLDIHESKVL